MEVMFSWKAILYENHVFMRSYISVKMYICKFCEPLDPRVRELDLSLLGVKTHSTFIGLSIQTDRFFSCAFGCHRAFTYD